MTLNNSLDYQTTQHRIILGNSNNGINNLSSGSSGQILLSGGASADPGWSTATYPSTAGTSGNIITSDGTNWISQAAPSSNISYVSGSLTNTQIKNLGTTPVTILSAPGSGKIIHVFTAMTVMIYGGHNAFTSSFPIYVGYTNNSGLFVAIGTLSQITATSSKAWCSGWLAIAVARSTVDNAPLVLGCPGSIGGNAANDNTFSYLIAYEIFTY